MEKAIASANRGLPDSEIVSGHDLPDVETVIEDHGEWSVVEKDPAVTADPPTRSRAPAGC